jgi:hypothetical protein
VRKVEHGDGNRTGNTEYRDSSGHKFGSDAGGPEGAVDDAYRGASALGDFVAVACDVTRGCRASIQGARLTHIERGSGV